MTTINGTAETIKNGILKFGFGDTTIPEGFVEPFTVSLSNITSVKPKTKSYIDSVDDTKVSASYITGDKWNIIGTRDVCNRALNELLTTDTSTLGDFEVIISIKDSENTIVVDGSINISITERTNLPVPTSVIENEPINVDLDQNGDGTINLGSISGVGNISVSVSLSNSDNFVDNSTLSTSYPSEIGGLDVKNNQFTGPISAANIFLNNFSVHSERACNLDGKLTVLNAVNETTVKDFLVRPYDGKIVYNGNQSQNMFYRYRDGFDLNNPTTIYGRNDVVKTVYMKVSNPLYMSLTTKNYGSSSSVYDSINGIWYMSGTNAQIIQAFSDVKLVVSDYETHIGETLIISILDDINDETPNTLISVELNDIEFVVANITQNLSISYLNRTNISLNIESIVERDIFNVSLTNNHPDCAVIAIETVGNVTPTYNTNTGIWECNVSSDADVLSLISILSNLKVNITDYDKAETYGSIEIIGSYSDGISNSSGTIDIDIVPTILSLSQSINNVYNNVIFGYNMFADNILTSSKEIVTATLTFDPSCSIEIKTYGTTTPTINTDGALYIWTMNGSKDDVQSAISDLKISTSIPTTDYTFNLSITDGFKTTSAIYKLLQVVYTPDSSSSLSFSERETSFKIGFFGNYTQGSTVNAYVTYNPKYITLISSYINGVYIPTNQIIDENSARIDFNNWPVEYVFDAVRNIDVHFKEDSYEFWPMTSNIVFHCEDTIKNIYLTTNIDNFDLSPAAWVYKSNQHLQYYNDMTLAETTSLYNIDDGFIGTISGDGNTTFGTMSFYNKSGAMSGHIPMQYASTVHNASSGGGLYMMTYNKSGTDYISLFVDGIGVTNLATYSIVDYNQSLSCNGEYYMVGEPTRGYTTSNNGNVLLYKRNTNNSISSITFPTLNKIQNGYIGKSVKVIFNSSINKYFLCFTNCPQVGKYTLAWYMISPGAISLSGATLYQTTQETSIPEILFYNSENKKLYYKVGSVYKCLKINSSNTNYIEGGIINQDMFHSSGIQIDYRTSVSLDMSTPFNTVKIYNRE